MTDRRVQEQPVTLEDLYYPKSPGLRAAMPCGTRWIATRRERVPWGTRWIATRRERVPWGTACPESSGQPAAVAPPSIGRQDRD